MRGSHITLQEATSNEHKMEGKRRGGVDKEHWVLTRLPGHQMLKNCKFQINQMAQSW